MATVHIAANLRAQLERWVCAGYPRETCGLLIGRQESASVEVREVMAARNLNTQRAADRYELDPENFLEADQAARDAGLELVGVWHSHPDHPAHPSPTDRALAWEGWSYLILSVVRNSVEDIRCWRLQDGDFVEEVILP